MGTRAGTTCGQDGGRRASVRGRQVAAHVVRPNVLNGTAADRYRFNWNTPFMLSPHNPGIVWLGGNRLFKSLNRGDTWVASADLTKQIDRKKVSLMSVPGDRSGSPRTTASSHYSTIVSVSESPVLPGVVWAGTDDGNVQVSKDSGATFTEVGKNMPGLPANHVYWISRIDASHFDAGTAYVAVDGHRDDDLKPYLFVTRNYGQSWKSIAGRPSLLRQYPGRARGSEEPRPALRRHRVRALHLARRRQEVAEVHEQPADRARRRHPDPSARQRPHRRHPRAWDLDCGRHQSAAAARGDAAAGSGALRRAARCGVSQRSAERPAGRRAEGVRRREPARAARR